MTVDRTDVLNRLHRGRDAFAAHCDAPIADFAKSYGPGKWTVREVLCHLADCEAAFYWRFLRAAGEPGSDVELFDENLWAERLDYQRRDPAVLRGLFTGLRDATAEMVQSLPEERLLGEARHPKRGLLAAWQYASLAANHVLHHLEQVEAARTGKAWVKTGPVTP